MAVVLAIDPGTTQSAWCVLKGDKVCGRGIEDNEIVLDRCRGKGDFGYFDHVAIEMIASYGMPVGREVFETVLWVGRFYESLNRCGFEPELVYRLDVKVHLCGSARAKDANIRQAVIDRFPRTGGGKCPQVGTKSSPGPLYGVSKDVWAALAVALFKVDSLKRGKQYEFGFG